MKFRAICLGLVALVFTTSGCLPYHNHPCWGFRLHPCSNGGACSPCAPVCSSPIHHPILHKLSTGSAGCSTCVGGGPIITQPVSYPMLTNPPVIGQPNPLQGPSIIPSRELPNPMPVKQSGY